VISHNKAPYPSRKSAGKTKVETDFMGSSSSKPKETTTEGGAVSACPIKHSKPAAATSSGCPVKHSPPPSSSSGCPVKHSSSDKNDQQQQQYNVYSQPIDPKNQMPAVANQLPSPQQKEVLSTERVKSTIPKVSNMLSIR
jgi:hypothetical protein